MRVVPINSEMYLSGHNVEKPSAPASGTFHNNVVMDLAEQILKIDGHKDVMCL